MMSQQSGQVLLSSVMGGTCDQRVYDDFFFPVQQNKYNGVFYFFLLIWQKN